MAWVSNISRFIDWLRESHEPSTVWSNVMKTSEKRRTGLKVRQRTVPLAQIGLPEGDDMRPTATEIDIRSAFTGEIGNGRRRALKKLRRALAGLASMAIDVSESELRRIVAGLVARLAEIRTRAAARLPRLAKRKVNTETALSGFRTLNEVHDVPAARSVLEWCAATLATAIAEAVVNAQLFKQELGYLDAVGFAFGIGGAIALIGVAAGIGWAQIRRPRLGRRLAGIALFAFALGVLLVLLIGLTHYRAALADHSVDPNIAAQASMSASLLAPFRDIWLQIYVIISLGGFVLVCWKSVSMWGFIDLRRLERAARQACSRLDAAKECARADCDAARADALDMVDGVLERAEARVEEGNETFARCQELRDSFMTGASTLADVALACEMEYREVVEMVNPLQERLARFAEPPPRIDVVEIAPDEAEIAARAALTARLIKVRDAMPPLTDQIGTTVDAAIHTLGDMAATAEDDARRHPRGSSDNVFRFAK